MSIKLTLLFYTVIIVFAVVVVVAVTGKKNHQFDRECCEYYCYDLDHDRRQFGQFSTYTAYPTIKESEFRQNLIPNCRPVKIWLLNRHGTRYPSQKAMDKSKALYDLRDEIIQNYAQPDNIILQSSNRGKLCNVDLELLRNWEWDRNVTSDNASQLAPRGYYESMNLAKQYQSLYPMLFERFYSADRYYLAYTVDDRVSGSFMAFAEGLFGPNATKTYALPGGREKDMILQAYEFCQASKDQSEQIFEKGSQLTKYQNTALYKQMIREVSARLGFRNPLKSPQITMIWNMCRYDQSWHIDRPSAWCAAFTPKHIDILEYGEDIQFYYRKSYGSSLNGRLACSTMADMLKHLNSTASPNVITYFTHSTLIYLMLTLMGAFHDDLPLLYSNYAEQHERQFRSSKICPFGANLAAIKFECPADTIEPYRIMFLHNQQTLSLDWCTDGVCKWSDLLEKYGHFMTENCESVFCSEQRNGSDASAVDFCVLVFSIILLLW